MTPELVFVLRTLLLSALVLGLEVLFRYRQVSRAARRAPARFSQPNPVVNLTGFRAAAPQPKTLAAARPDAAPLTTIVRLEPLPRHAQNATDYVIEKRAA